LTPGGEGSSPRPPSAVERKKRAVRRGAGRRGRRSGSDGDPLTCPPAPRADGSPRGNADFGGLEMTPSPLSAPSSSGGGQPPARRGGSCATCGVWRRRRRHKNERCNEEASNGVRSPRGQGRRRPRPVPAVADGVGRGRAGSAFWRARSRAKGSRLQTSPHRRKPPLSSNPPNRHSG